MEVDTDVSRRVYRRVGLTRVGQIGYTLLNNTLQATVLTGRCSFNPGRIDTTSSEVVSPSHHKNKAPIFRADYHSHRLVADPIPVLPTSSHIKAPIHPSAGSAKTTPITILQALYQTRALVHPPAGPAKTVLYAGPIPIWSRRSRNHGFSSAISLSSSMRFYASTPIAVKSLKKENRSSIFL